MPERVWEQSLTSDLADAGIEYTVLDDFHFKNAGLDRRAAHGYYLTEDDGQRALDLSRQRAAAVHDSLSASRTRRSIPAAASPSSSPARWWCSATTARSSAPGPRRRSTSTTTAGCGGSSMPCRPTATGFSITTLAEADRERAAGRQDLSARRQLSRDDRVGACRSTSRSNTTTWCTSWSTTRAGRGSSGSVRGGFWRNFKVKYPEANEMYARMMMVSRRLRAGASSTAASTASWLRLCPARRSTAASAIARYWHGAFGGIYLPHLRNAIYNQLIAADNLLDQADRQDGRLGRSDGRRLQLRRPPGSPPGQRQAGLPCSPRPRRPALRARRPLDLPQPAGHARPPARSLSPQGARPARTTARRRRQHSRPRRLQAGRPRPAAAIRSLSAQEPARSFLRSRAPRSQRSPRRSDRARRLSCRASTKPKSAATATASGAALAAGPRRPAAMLKITKGITLDAGSPRSKSPICWKICRLISAALSRSSSTCRAARRRRRPLFSRSGRAPTGPAGPAARSE